jgi:hypothetical protein
MPSVLSRSFSAFHIFSRGIMSRRSSKSEDGSPALSDDDGSAFRIPLSVPYIMSCHEINTKKFQAPKNKLVLGIWDFIVFQILPMQLVYLDFTNQFFYVDISMCRRQRFILS